MNYQNLTEKQLSPISPHFCRLLHLAFYGCGYIVHEVMMQQFGDSDQQQQVNGIFIQNLVHITPVGVDGFGEPCHGSALRLQLGSDHISYV